MSGAQIAKEVHAALLSLPSEVGDGAFPIVLIRAAERVNPWDAVSADTQFDVTGFVSKYPNSLIDGTTILKSDRKVMLSAEGEAPKQTDKLVISGGTYSIVDVEPFSPAGVPLYYIVQARA